jgi:hypothetical protein
MVQMAILFSWIASPEDGMKSFVADTILTFCLRFAIVVETTCELVMERKETL